MRTSFTFWSVLTICFVQRLNCERTNSFQKALSSGLEHSQDLWAGHSLNSWGGSTSPLNPEKESGWLENSDDDMAWKVGLEILEHCMDLNVHEKSNCMQFFFQTNLLFV